MRKVTEAELAAWTKELLRAQGWDLYDEVQPYQGGRIADLVGVRDGRVLVIETKTSLTLESLGQALGWVPYADAVAVVVPHVSAHVWRSAARDYGKRSAELFGIGVYSVGPTKYSPMEVKEHVRCAELDPGGLRDRILDALRPEHQSDSWARAGTRNGKRVTKFSLTAKALAHAVSVNPGKKVGDYVETLAHHYASRSSAVSNLRNCIDRNVIDEIRIDAEGKLWPCENQTEGRLQTIRDTGSGPRHD